MLTHECITHKYIKQNKAKLFFRIAWAALTNGYVQGFAAAHIYSGALKKVCTPGLNCYSCPGAFFACPIGSLQSLLSNRSLKASLYVIGFLFLFGTICGRGVCGFLCPFGLVQDLIYRIPFFRKRKNLPLHKILRFLRYAFLLLFVIIFPIALVDEFGFGLPWFCKYVCPSGTLLAGIPLVAGNEMLRGAVGVLFSWKMSILIAVILLSLWVWRPFCKYVCPLGVIYGAFNRVAIYKFHVDKSKCTECGACRRACKADIKVWHNPNSSECVRCGECVNACNFDALSKNIPV